MYVKCTSCEMVNMRANGKKCSLCTQKICVKMGKMCGSVAMFPDLALEQLEKE